MFMRKFGKKNLNIMTHKTEPLSTFDSLILEINSADVDEITEISNQLNDLALELKDKKIFYGIKNDLIKLQKIMRQEKYQLEKINNNDATYLIEAIFELKSPIDRPTIYEKGRKAYAISNADYKKFAYEEKKSELDKLQFELRELKKSIRIKMINLSSNLSPEEKKQADTPSSPGK